MTALKLGDPTPYSGFIGWVIGNCPPHYVYEWFSTEQECLYIGKGAMTRALLCDAYKRSPKCWAGAKSYMRERRLIYVRILVITKTSQEALAYESKLIALRQPKWNTSGVARRTQ